MAKEQSSSSDSWSSREDSPSSDAPSDNGNPGGLSGMLQSAGEGIMAAAAYITPSSVMGSTKKPQKKAKKRPATANRPLAAAKRPVAKKKTAKKKSSKKPAKKTSKKSSIARKGTARPKKKKGKKKR